MAKRGGSRRAHKGGARKTRKLSPKLKAWNEKVMKVFREKRKSNPNYKLRDAMKDAKKLA